MDWVPKKIFFTKGVGIAKSEQISYIRALTDAKLAKYNLIQVSSIVPPNCKKITPKEGLQNLQPGQTLYVVLARISSNIPNQQIAASIGVAKPYHPKIHGYLAEYENINQSSEEVAKFSEDM